jgi:hypothetical protein
MGSRREIKKWRGRKKRGTHTLAFLVLSMALRSSPPFLAPAAFFAPSDMLALLALAVAVMAGLAFAFITTWRTGAA